MHAKMYKLGKLTCGLSIFKKTYFEKCSQSKNGLNEYLHEQFNQKKRLRNIYKQTNVTSISKFRILNQQLIKRP